MDIRAPEYGRYLDQFAEGDVFVHPRGFTIYSSFSQEFATTFMDANPLYLNDVYARAHGFDGIVVPPLLVLNLVLSMGVQNDSEKAIAHLGYYDVRFLAPVYPGDTIRSMTRVIAKKDRGAGKPGIVTVRTIGVSQKSEVVLRYDRKIMIPTREAPAGAAAGAGSTKVLKEFPLSVDGQPRIPRYAHEYPGDLTGLGTYFEDFRPGEVIVHGNGRTVTDEHFTWTYRVGNTHPLHFDRLYSKGREGAASDPLRVPAQLRGGDPIVYGGLVFAWIAGLASRDTTENALFDLSYDEGYHTQPTVAGDTLSAISRVTEVSDGPTHMHAGIVSLKLIGVKNIRAADAVERFGEDLFLRENDKEKLGKQKIPEKIFEIERKVLVKKRPKS
jgi:2-methylfumaryl-CoA hydratase